MADWAGLTCTDDSFDYAPPGAPPYETPKFASNKDLLAAFDKSVAEARAALATAEDGKMLAPWTLMAGGKTIMTMPRVGVIRTFVMNHTIHHRAQLGVYLRLNDVPLPAALRANRRRTIALYNTSAKPRFRCRKNSPPATNAVIA